MSQILDELADNIANLPPRDRLAFLTRMEAASISDPQKDRIKKIQAAAERNPAPLRFALAGLKRAGVTLDQLVAGNGLSVLDQAMAQKHFDESSRWALKAALRQAHAIG